ncbi:UDP-N-acetylmuramoyl-tripeptide--D-alanyl-D-alanine ligase [Odoribacter lunatus]|uniref:UDP-N-acetylmuramoyl-tripeptide--D-alanyl-D- alanine ligase n=1 Tax=Odoribacter lunatus TaxID=2941335 RepID=UPI00203AB5DD|nr:UDP-N-acetylmuramoyl-tripeptide--D-alanyl-D-alanine ligase [Odoribacter lunatus]
MQNLEYLYDRYIKGKRITTDSRTVREGDVFIALKGENFNGNLFALQAIEAGASVAFIDDSTIQHERCIPVTDTLIFLQEIASYHRHRLGIPILGITGTNGKTTTKELCHAVLSVKYKTFATQGNFNNHIGVPLTLLSLDETTQFGIVEMGANHPGEIKTLCDIADPDYGIITNIGEAHLEGFGSYNTIIETKKQLYEHIQAKNGQLFVNDDDPLLVKLSEDIHRNTYGKNGNQAKGEIKQSIPFLVYSLKTLKGDLYIRTHLIGGYNFDNAMAASCVGLFFGISPLDIQKAIEGYQPSNLRSQLVKTEKNTIILDAYNANPSSMKAALTNFSEFRADNKILILGEMRELGKASETAHKEIFEMTRNAGFTQIILIGNSFAHYGNNVNFIRHFQTTDDLIVWLQSQPIESACILIKGSRGNKLERIVEYL